MLLCKEDKNRLFAATRILNQAEACIENNKGKVFLKFSKDRLDVVIKGTTGLVQINIKTSFEVEEPVYCSLEYVRFVGIITKFNFSDEIQIELLENTVVFSDESNNKITLATIYYSTGSSETLIIDNFIKDKRDEVLSSYMKISSNTEFRDSLQKTTVLFNTMSVIDSIGFTEKNLLYSDRSIVYKDQFSTISISNRDNFGEYIPLHRNIVSILETLLREEDTFYLSKDYNVFYYERDDVAIYLLSPSREIALPTEEEFLGIQASTVDYKVESTLGKVKDLLDFYNGFYDTSTWQTLSFSINSGEVNVFYNRPSLQLHKKLAVDAVRGQGTFLIASDVLYKLVCKYIQKSLGDNIIVSITGSADSIGVTFTLKEGETTIVLPKMEED